MAIAPVMVVEVDTSQATEVVRAADLWLRVVALWESAEEDELLTKFGELVDEWQGFKAKDPP